MFRQVLLLNLIIASRIATDVGLVVTLPKHNADIRSWPLATLPALIPNEQFGVEVV